MAIEAAQPAHPKRDPSRKAFWNQNRKPGPPKQSETNIVQALEKFPMTFEELVKETGRARITVAEGLAELEKQGRIERKVEPPLSGKRRHRIVIHLTEKELTPLERALRHLEGITAAQKIDIESGRKLLTDDVVQAILEITSLEWNPAEEEFEPTPSLSLGFDEAVLVVALARYHFEARVVLRIDNPHDSLQRLFIERSKEPEKLLGQFYKAHRRDPRVFPALEVARKRRVDKELDALLDWIEPHVFLRYRREEEPIDTFETIPDISDAMRFVAAPNFIASAFRLAQKEYISSHVIPAWSTALKDWKPRAPLSREKKEKVGEKSWERSGI